MGRPVNAIHFNIDTAAPFYENLDQIAYRLRWNRWNGKKTIQIIIEDS
jgi:single-stranded-DNA-specific exonuclease